MMKKTIWILTIIALLAGSIFLALLWTDIYKSEVRKREPVDGQVEGITNKQTAAGNITQKELNEMKDQGLNQFGDSQSVTELTEGNFNNYIHGMSHQKVKASKKWSFYEITDNRIKWLLNSLDVIEVEHENTYRRILTKWNKGDFSKIDEDHNGIWAIQDGTVGKATGILTPEEEKAYIQNQ